MKRYLSKLKRRLLLTLVSSFLKRSSERVAIPAALLLKLCCRSEGLCQTITEFCNDWLHLSPDAVFAALLGYGLLRLKAKLDDVADDDDADLAHR